MKVNKLIILGAAGFMFASCNDSFLDRYPEDSITEKNFFKTVSDLETYTNSLYNWGAPFNDNVSDNVLYSETSGVFDKMMGNLTPDKAGQWGWGDVRSINYFLCRYQQAAGDQREINHFVGLAKLYRARAYYSKVQSYSDVPWYSKDLQTTDIEELYKTQDSRSLVVDSIMQDLDFAVKHMKDGDSKTKIYRNIALAEQARIALNEGTFRKYHPELGLNDSERFLKIAIEATAELMKSGKYKISDAPTGTMPPYRALFSSYDLSTNPEIILYSDYDKALGRYHGAGSLLNYNNSISRSLMEDYLAIKDGKAVPFHTLPGYNKMSIPEVFKNRDPRMAETIMEPGYIKDGSKKPFRQNMELGGYGQIKFCHELPMDQWAWGMSYNDLPIIRYAAILLTNAEAKAELGILTQEDVDNTVNLLRRRVGIPDAKLSEWLSSPDPVQMNRYSNINSTQNSAVAEIRRERRIELACEGVRYNDLMRWGCGKLLEVAPEGAYVSKFGLLDITGDNFPDVGFFATKEEADEAVEALGKDPETGAKYDITTYIVTDKSTISLTEGTKGYIRRASQVNAWQWVEPKYYYSPLSTKDLKVNENLIQNKYWKTK